MTTVVAPAEQARRSAEDRWWSMVARPTLAHWWLPQLAASLRPIIRPGPLVPAPAHKSEIVARAR